MNLKVFISAPNKTFIAITDDGNLVTGRTEETESKFAPNWISFGPATTENFNAISTYLTRLKINATDA